MPLFPSINVVSIEVPDLDEGRRFYSEVLELGDPAYDFPEAGWIEWRLPGKPTDLAITVAEPGWEPHPGVTAVFDTDDCHLSREKLIAKGVRCDDVVPVPGMVTFCSFYDPFGNQLQMASAAPDA